MGRRVLACLVAVLVAVALGGCSQGSVSVGAEGEVASSSQGGQTRTYFIAADPVAWDYAPAARNLVTGEEFGEEENVFVERGPARIGHVYIKSLFREYTDASFQTHKPRPAEWEHLGVLGPVIRAEVGDTVRVVFRNNTPFPANMHPHGLFYEKDSEGSPYDDGTSGADKADDVVPPRGTHTYIWKVPERAGPGPHDPSSIMWMYHSHTNEVADQYAGLMGPIVVTRRGMAKADGSPVDVERELVVNFMVMDENASPWLDNNIQAFAREPKTVNKDDEEFVESNLMHSINGYVFGNQPGLDLRGAKRVRWYVMGMGNEVDLHTPHWHGNTVLAMGMRTDVVSLLPAAMVVADMEPDDPGTWLFHCHVTDHINAGMQSKYRT